MTVDVKLFARARDLAGTDTVRLELPAQATVLDLREALARSVPALEPLAPNLLVAVGNDYASDTTPLPPRADLACFPPVSGG